MYCVTLCHMTMFANDNEDAAILHTRNMHYLLSTRNVNARMEYKLHKAAAAQ